MFGDGGKWIKSVLNESKGYITQGDSDSLGRYEVFKRCSDEHEKYSRPDLSTSTPFPVKGNVLNIMDSNLSLNL
jgi:hypothetical protein